ncbi:hypothetical protein [Scytonema sp. PCC 10023]
MSGEILTETKSGAFPPTTVPSTQKQCGIPPPPYVLVGGENSDLTS